MANAGSGTRLVGLVTLIFVLANQLETFSFGSHWNHEKNSINGSKDLIVYFNEMIFWGLKM